MILYCRTGNRSGTRRRRSCSELGYENVASIARRHRRLAGAGLPVVAAEGLTAEQRTRYSRHTLLPEVGVEGQLKLLEREGAAARRRRARRADRALPRRGRRRHARPRRRRRRRRVQPAAPGDPQHRAGRDAEDRVGAARRSRRSTPTSRSSSTTPASTPTNILEIIERLRRDRRRRRQLPHPLPAQRRLGAAAQAGRLGLDPRLRRADLDLRPLRGALLPLPLPDPAAARAGAELRRRRRARRDGRRRWACCRPTR